MSQFFRQAQDPVSCATHAWGAVAAFFGGMVLLLRALWAGANMAALAAAMRAVSQEMAPRGLRVHCLAPGWIRTPMLETAIEHMGESYAAREKERYPLGIGEPEDVARMAAFLLSDKARWITGQNFVLGGGCY